MRPVRILVNATTITVGGGVQAAVSFIEYAVGLGLDGPQFMFAVSPSVHQGLRPLLRKDARVHLCSRSPAQPAGGWRTRRYLLGLERVFRPNMIYSIGFPSYVGFSAIEAGRYTNAWEVCALPAARSRLTLTERVARSLKSSYRVRWARRARYFETQTEVAKAGIIRRLRVAPEHVFVLPNSVNPRFVEAGSHAQSRNSSTQMVFCLSAAYPHKNLTIIPEVAAILSAKLNRKVIFVLTLPEDADLWRSISNEARRLGVREWIRNVGPLKLDDCVSQYRAAHCLFLPTLAEMFSASYLEAMAMDVPIVTTDLDFARTICNDAAVYYDALSAEAAADAIHSVLTNDHLRDTLIKNGRRRLGDFPDPETKHRRLLDWLIGIATSAHA